MASRYWVGGTANWDATAGTKWATTSGGAGGAAVPTSSDDVFFDANSGANTVTIAATSNALTVNCTGFTGTLTGSSGLTVAGSITLVSGMTFSHSGTITVSAAATLTSAGKSYTNISFTGTNTKTLADDLNISGTLSGSSTTTINGSFNINVNNLTASVSILKGTGTPKIVMNTNGGTWSSSSIIGIDLDLNANVTISGSVTYADATNTNATTLTQVGGVTVTTTGSTLTWNCSGKLNCPTVTWNNLSTTGAGVKTMLADVTVGGTYTSVGSSAFAGNFILYAKNVTCNSGTSVSISSGTPKLKMTTNGGTWSGTGTIAIDFYIQANITVSGTVTITTNGILNYVSGTVTTTSSTLQIAGSCTIDSNGITWNNVTHTGAATVTNNSLLTCATLTFPNAAVTWTGTSGWTCTTLTNTTITASRTYTLKSTVTYACTGTTTLQAVSPSVLINLVASTASSSALFNITDSQSLIYVTATDINSSGGSKVYSKRIRPQDLTRTNNWYNNSDGLFPMFLNL